MTEFLQTSVTFLGGGNMASALIAGLLAKGQAVTRLHVIETDAQKRQDFAEQGIFAYDAHDIEQVKTALSQAEVVVLAVKPQVLKEVLAPLKALWHGQLVISIVAGIETDSLKSWLGNQVKLVRAMPNTPAMIQMGATGLFASQGVTEQLKATAEQVMKATGLVLWVEDEKLLHAVTAVSGSAPAYFFYLLENMIQAGESFGLTNQQATALAMQTALGSAQMALTSHDSPTELRRKVTSPNGTTESAIAEMDKHHMNQIIQQAMQACVNRSQALSQAFGK